MTSIRWTEQAVKDLQHIRGYIERDSPRYGRLVAERLYEATNRLMEFPLSGRVVPELNRDNVRELMGRAAEIKHVKRTVDRRWVMGWYCVKRAAVPLLQALPRASLMKGCVRILVATGVWLAWSGEEVGAQESPVDRTSRLVQYSPHFDEVVRPWGGLNCPAAPLTLIGFESEVRSEADSAELTIRALAFQRTYNIVASEQPNPYVAALIGLTPMPRDLSATRLDPSTPYAMDLDSTGFGQMSVPAGDYVLSVTAMGVRGGNGVLRLRAGSRDSLHIYLDGMPICDLDLQ